MTTYHYDFHSLVFHPNPAPNTPEVHCLNALLWVHRKLQIKAKRSQALILCLGGGGVWLHGLFRMMIIFFIYSAHTHTKSR